MNRRNFIKSSSLAATLPLVASTAFAQQQSAVSNQKSEIFKWRIKPITKEERLARIENAKRLMHSHNIDALLFEGGVTLNYFTGVSWGRSERLFAMVLPKNGEPAFIAPKFEESRAQEQVGDSRLLTWEEHESPYELIKQILRDNNSLLGKVGIEETVRYFVTENLSKEASTISLVNGTQVTAGCRSVKSEHEIELMQVANDITAEVFKSSVPQLKEGMTEREFGSIISKSFSEYGVGGGALVLFGENSAHPHGLIKQNKLKENDIVLIDGGCSVEGYASDVTRTIVFGKPTDKMKQVFDIVRTAQTSALIAAKPGVTGEVLDASARKEIVNAGYGPDYKYFTHRLGHGIGMEGHEWYYLVRGNKHPEEPGNTHSNEPGIYIVGEFGVRLEDTLLITDDGAKLLLPQAKSLQEMF
ncbi:MAG: aminopeptidase P family protein [Ignavibacteriae bacterium]|nr:aminopeptidase P family protein [Ignavibacteriota bacterium]